MSNLLQIFLEINICLLVLGLVYLITFRKETAFTASRFTLLSLVVVSLILPWIDLPNFFGSEVNISTPENFYSFIPDEFYNIPETDQAVSVQPQFTWTAFGVLIYLGISLILTTVLGYQLYQILRIWSKSEKAQRKDGYILIPTEGQWPTFSFLNLLFYDNTVEVSSEEKEKIIGHELVHINEKHTLDVLFMELMKIIFWINPVVWLLRSRLEEIHEYCADKKLVRDIDPQYYSSLLARMALKNMNISLGLHFNKSTTLKRIAMMKLPTRKIQNWKWSVLSVVLVSMFLVFSCSDEAMDDLMTTSSQKAFPEVLKTDLLELQDNYPEGDFVYLETDISNKNTLESVINYNPENIAHIHVFEDRDVIGLIVNKNGPIKQIAATEEDGIFSVVDNPATPKEGYENYYKKLFTIIDYPQSAREAGAEGKVYVMFIVNESGNITNVQAVKGVGYGLDEAAIAAIASSEPWNPASHKGRNVKQKIVLPVQFKLDNENKATIGVEHKNTVTSQFQKDDLFTRVDQSASPIGGYENFFRELMAKIDISEENMQGQSEGKVYVQFVIDKEGNSVNSQIIKGISPEIDQLALAAFNDTNIRWNAAHHNGQVVNQQLVLPIKFEFDK